MGEHGIQNLKEMVKFSLVMGETIESAVTHGPHKPATLAKLMEMITVAPAAFQDFGKIPAEAMDLDDAEHAELVGYIKSEFDLENDVAEMYAEKGLELALKILDLVKLVAA